MASQLAAINAAVGNTACASQTQFLAALQRHDAATTRRLDSQEQDLMVQDRTSKARSPAPGYLGCNP
eukprot:2553390-Pyramimonas_sp.AAC.1